MIPTSNYSSPQKEMMLDVGICWNDVEYSPGVEVMMDRLSSRFRAKSLHKCRIAKISGLTAGLGV